MLRWGEALAAAVLTELVMMGAMEMEEGRAAGRAERRRRRSAERQDEQIILNWYQC